MICFGCSKAVHTIIGVHTVLLHNDGCNVASGLNGVQARHIRCSAEFGHNVRAHLECHLLTGTQRAVVVSIKAWSCQVEKSSVPCNGDLAKYLFA